MRIFPTLVCVTALSACTPGRSDEPAGNNMAGANLAPAATPATDAGDPVASALSAAPAAIAANAAVMGGDGKMLRQGSNGWTCMPDLPHTPGTDPMCLDKAGLAWAAAWIGKKEPASDAVGLAYMLKGGSDASNTDPFATKPDGEWVDSGPHVMILNAKAAESSGYPAGANPDTSKPFVMFAGTPYAHIMMPVQ